MVCTSVTTRLMYMLVLGCPCLMMEFALTRPKKILQFMKLSGSEMPEQEGEKQVKMETKKVRLPLSAHS